MTDVQVGQWLVSLTLVSILTVLLGITVGVRWIARLPDDFFVSPQAPRDGSAKPIWARLPFRILRNLAGLILLLAGIVMLVLPGQGLATMLVGVMLMDFPGKKAIERWLLGTRQVEVALNWLRRQAGRGPFQFPHEINEDASEVNIRRMTGADWHVWKTLRLAALEDSPDAFGSVLADARLRQDEYWQVRLETADARSLPLVAEVSGIPVGLAWAVSADDDEVAHVYQMWVAPTARRTGVATALLAHIERWARAAGMLRLDLEVTVGSGARLLYERAAYVATGEVSPLREGSGLQSETMCKLLGPEQR